MADERYTDPQYVLNTITRAVQEERLGVIEATLAETGEKVNVLVSYWDDELNGRGTALFPLAILFSKSPFEVLLPPDGAYTVKHEDGQDTVVQ